MSFTVIIPPGAEPVSLVEAKVHLRVTYSTDDTYITSLIVAARQWAEDYTRRAFITQTIAAKYDHFMGCFHLERSPVQSVTSLTYVDNNGDTQTLNNSEYITDLTSVPARLSPAYASTWPSTRGIINAVTITYVSGYGNASTDVPQPIIQAMLLIIGHYYENRELAVVGTTVSALPMAVDALLMPYRVY